MADRPFAVDHRVLITGGPYAGKVGYISGSSPAWHTERWAVWVSTGDKESITYGGINLWVNAEDLEHV